MSISAKMFGFLPVMNGRITFDEELKGIVCAANYGSDYNIVSVELNEETQTAALAKVFDTNIIAGSGLNIYDYRPFIYDRKIQRCYSIVQNADYKWHIINSSVDGEGTAIHTPIGLTEFDDVDGAYVYYDNLATETASTRAFYYSTNRKYIYILLKVTNGGYYKHKWVKVALSSGAQTLINEEIYDSEHYDGWPEDIENGEIAPYHEELPTIGSMETSFYYNSPNKSNLQCIFKQEFEASENIFEEPSITCFLYLAYNIFIFGTSTGKIFRTIDGGITWEHVATIGSGDGWIEYGTYIGNGIALVIAQTTQIVDPTTELHILRTNDYGETWVDSGQLFGLQNSGSIAGISSGVVIGSVAHTPYILRSTDYGVTWNQLSVEQPITQNMLWACELCDNGVAITNAAGSVLRSTNYGVTWVAISTPTEIGNSTMEGLKHIGDGIILAGYSQGKIMRSTDYGLTWSYIGTYGGRYIEDFGYFEDGIVLATKSGSPGAVLRSTDYGVTWDNLGAVGDQQDYFCVANKNDGIALIGTIPSGLVIKSTDYGETWSRYITSYFYEINYLLNGFDYEDNLLSSYAEYKNEDGETTYYQDIDYTLMEVARIGLSRYQSVNENQNSYSDWHDPLPFISVGGQTYLLVAKNGRNGEGEEIHTLGFLNIDTRAFISTGRTSYDSTPHIYVAPDNSYALLAPDTSNPIMLFTNGDFSNTNFKRLINIDTIERRKTLMCAYFVSPSGPPVIIDYSPTSPKVYAIDWKTYGNMPIFANNKIYASLSEGYYIYDGNIGKLMLTEFDEDDEPGDFYIPSFDGYAGKAWIKWYAVDDMLGSSALFEAPLIQ